MRTDELRFLLDYDAWATEQLLATAERLSADEFAAAADPGQRSPRRTFLHCASGMRAWRERLQGLPATESPSADSYPTPAAIRELWRSEHGLLETYVAGLTEHELDAVFEQRRPDRLLRAARWQFVVHLILHDMQHRSELAQVLTLLGNSPGEIGMTAFLQQRHGVEQMSQ